MVNGPEVTGKSPEYLEACTREEAFKQLGIFDEYYDRWTKKQKKTQKKSIYDFLKDLDLECDPDVSSKWGVVDCRKFVLRTLESLRKPSNDFVFLYPFYLGVYGSVTGYALKWDVGKEPKVNSELFLGDWKQRFENEGWERRIDILNGFQSAVANCTQWDKSFWDTLEHFLAHCEATSSLPTNVRPEDSYCACGTLIDVWRTLSKSWKKIAIVYPESEHPEGQTDDTVSKVFADAGVKTLDYAPRLLKLIHSACSDTTLFKVSYLGTWHDILFKYTLPYMDKTQISTQVQRIREQIEEISNQARNVDEKKYIAHSLESIRFYTEE